MENIFRPFNFLLSILLVVCCLGSLLAFTPVAADEPVVPDIPRKYSSENFTPRFFWPDSQGLPAALAESDGTFSLPAPLQMPQHKPVASAERPAGAGFLNDVYVNGTTGNNGYDGSSPVVLAGGVGPKKTIQAGINAVYSSGEVHVAEGNYYENVVIDIPVFLTGAGARTTVIDGGGAGTAVDITAYDESIVLSGFTIRNGNGYWAGGIVNGDRCYTILYDCAVTGNTGSQAGGIFSENGEVIMLRCLIANNTGYEVGGGILCVNSVIEMVATTVSGNALGPGGHVGGGIFAQGSLLLCLYSTVANNSATGLLDGEGGGLACVSAYLLSYATIVAGNHASQAGTNNATYYNQNVVADLACIDSENSCQFTNPSSQVNTDPRLGPLQSNGGPTDTHAITIDSPAFDRSSDIVFISSDQRGVARPQGTACDVGAFEVEMRPDASVVSQGATGPETIYFSTSAGGIFDLQALPRTSCPGTLTEGMVMPYGLFSFRIAGIAPGATVRVTIKFPRVIPATFKYFKCSGTGQMTDVTTLVTHNPGDDFVVLTLTDGGPGDLDGAVNGRITDPGGPAWVVNAVPQSSSAYIAPPQKTVGLPSLMVQSAVLSAAEVQPGQPVSVTATVANRGDAGGAMKLALTVNGEQEAVQGVAVNSGGTSQVSFTVKRDEPGTYSVYVGGTYAGEFTVSPSIDPTVVLVISLIMVCTSLVLGAVMLRRRQSAVG